MNFEHRRILFLSGAVIALVGERADAQDTTAMRLAPVIVEVGRGAHGSPLDLPFAVTVQTPDSTRPGQRHLSLDETLWLIPGLSVSNRNNPSQDPRISIRGQTGDLHPLRNVVRHFQCALADRSRRTQNDNALSFHFARRAFSLGSARASRALFGALAEKTLECGAFSLIEHSARARNVAREARALPRLFAPLRIVSQSSRITSRR